MIGLPWSSLWHGMDDPVTPPSPQLSEANRWLHELRAQVRAQRVGEFTSSRQAADALPWDADEPFSANLATAVETFETLPDHLGWGSAAVTAAIRAAQQRHQVVAMRSETHGPSLLPTPPATNNTPTGNPRSDTHYPENSPAIPANEGFVKLYPDIALGMLRNELAAPGRIWLLLRHMDGEGRGWIRIDIIKRQLTDKTSRLRVCGRRQLRNLLRQGEGAFWQRDKERIWLRSAAKVAAALDVTRLAGRPVALPVRALLGGIGDVRAHFYASFHSGRVKETEYGRQAMPIARDTLAAISGVGRRSQRAYEKRTGMAVQHNFAVGEPAATDTAQRRGWQQGGAVFELKDYRGEQGQKGRTYLAWQLPNSYGGPHGRRPKGRQKRINHVLADLFMKGMTGNGEETIEKQYFANGAQAARSHGRDPGRDAYWPRHRTGNRSYFVWQVVVGKERI